MIARIARVLVSAVAVPAVATPAAGAAEVPVEGEWGGRTSDFLPASFQAHDGRVENPASSSPGASAVPATGKVTAPSRELPGCQRTAAAFTANPGPVPPCRS